MSPFLKVFLVGWWERKRGGRETHTDRETWRWRGGKEERGRAQDKDLKGEGIKKSARQKERERGDE